MAASVLFQGGPCDGKRAEFDEADVGTGTVSCGGQLYDLHSDGGGFYTATVHELSGVGAANPTGIPDGGARSAWRRFLHTIGHKVPDQINASKRMRIQLRALGRR